MRNEVKLDYYLFEAKSAVGEVVKTYNQGFLMKIREITYGPLIFPRIRHLLHRRLLSPEEMGTLPWIVPGFSFPRPSLLRPA